MDSVLIHEPQEGGQDTPLWHSSGDRLRSATEVSSRRPQFDSERAACQPCAYVPKYVSLNSYLDQ